MVKYRLRKYSKTNEEIYATMGGGGIAGNIILEKDESGNNKYYFKKRDFNQEPIPIPVNGKNAARFNEDGFLKLPEELSSYFD